MKALVVYESMFGNTREVAEAVAAGLRGHLEVELHDVASAPPADDTWDLVVVGGPTHAFSLSRASTRAEAIAKGGTEGSVDIGLREWVDSLAPPPRHQAFACFDTRARAVRHLPGSAAHKVSHLAHALGFTILGRESFWVSGTPGPLVAGDLERARRWGTALAEKLTDVNAANTD